MALYLRALFAVALLAAGAMPAWAEDCALKRVAELPLTPDSKGRPTTEFTINGVPHRFIVSLAIPYSGVTRALASKLDLQHSGLPMGAQAWLFGHDAVSAVVLSGFSIGPVPFDPLDVLVMPTLDDDQVEGAIGLDVLEQFDVETDYAHNRLALYLNSHCPGKAVYWTGAFSNVSMQILETGAIGIPMQLDEKPVLAGIDDTRDFSIMATGAAGTLLGLTPDSPGVETGDKLPEHPHLATYKYPFKALVAGGLVISNPRITLYKSQQCTSKRRLSGPQYPGASEACYGMTDLQIGTAVLKQLRMLFSFKEKIVYLTSATASDVPTSSH